MRVLLGSHILSGQYTHSAVAPVVACVALTFTRTCTRTDVTHTHAWAIP